MEIAITEAQIVRRCVVIGEGRQCTAALIELEMDHAVKYDPEEIITKGKLLSLHNISKSLTKYK